MNEITNDDGEVSRRRRQRSGDIRYQNFNQKNTEERKIRNSQRGVLDSVSIRRYGRNGHLRLSGSKTTRGDLSPPPEACGAAGELNSEGTLMRQRKYMTKGVSANGVSLNDRSEQSITSAQDLEEVTTSE